VAEQSLYEKSAVINFNEIKLTRAEVSKILKKFSLGEANENKILLALTEYLTNIVKHTQPCASEVSVYVKLNDSHICFIVHDNGGYFSDLNQNIINQQAPMFDESGMGLGIISHLFPSFEYKHQSGWNIFELKFKYIDTKHRNVIAIIDDEPMQREILTSYVSDKYEVATYQDGQDFLSHMSELTFDLVICDIGMPNIDGLAVKNALQLDPVMSQVPFIFLTANDDPTIENFACELGIDNYLIKPIGKNKFLMAIERAIIRNKQLCQQHKQSINGALKPDVTNDNEHYFMALKTDSPSIGGGDFVVQKSFDDKTIMVLADVMGHDVTSKFFAHSFDGFIKGLIEQSPQMSMANIFSLLSKQVFNDPLLNQTLLTCIGVELNKDHIKIVSAGHPSPLLLSKGGSNELEVVGRLPGICEDTCYETKHISLNFGERLLFFTDGFFDWAKDQQQKSEFIDIIAKLNNEEAKPSLTELSGQIYETFKRFCDDPQDDMTFIILEKK